MIHTIIDALLIGKPKPFRGDDTKSAMARDPTDAYVRLTKLGFEGDEVADKKVHGGPDKAVHLYPPEHYPFWNVKLEGHHLLSQPGAFGENLSATGFLEDRVHIGDIFRIGTALLQISQGRQPCWKLDHRFSVHGLSREVIRSGKCGLYFRVLEEGEVKAGDEVQQVERADHGYSVAQVFHLLVGRGHRDADALPKLQDLSQLDMLATDWRDRAGKLATTKHD